MTENYNVKISDFKFPIRVWAYIQTWLKSEEPDKVIVFEDKRYKLIREGLQAFSIERLTDGI